MTDPRRRSRRRPHPALGARILATGLGATGMLGLTATLASTSSANEQTAAPADVVSAPQAPQPIPEVEPAPIPLSAVPIHRRVVIVAPSSGGGSASAGSGNTAGRNGSSASSAPSGSSGTGASAPRASSTPARRSAPAPAPVASSGGSR